ncbi:MAG TPA: YlxR family protein [Candidatus Binataceae bacterium]|nr:YlxR family protein [Candidatus Binataceae bacterium]
MPKESHSPVRTCLGCMRRDAQSAMLRVVLSNGHAVLDAEKKLPGRGGYLHASADCVRRFVGSKVRQFKSLRSGIDKEQRMRIAETIRTRLDRETSLE